MINTDELDKIIVGRVLPHIYAFSTNTIPNYLKVGDTYRPVDRRLNEWRHYYPQLDKLYDRAAVIDNVFFRDFAVHDFLKDKHARLEPKDLPDGVFYSREFFKGAAPSDVDAAFTDIETDYHSGTQKYKFYDIDNRLPENITYARNQTFEPHPNQQTTIDNFNIARAAGRTNLLMYAVMRFGKSFTAMCCATEMSARLVVVTSAKADVLREWKKTVESHVRFADYDFVCSDDLLRENNLISEKLESGRSVVVFLTLQDLQGEDIKKKHADLFKHEIDLLLIDETHFGARAEKYGEVLRSRGVLKDISDEISSEEKETVESYNQIINKSFDAKIRIHLSGTPYKILMGSEFKKEDIIAFYQFTDIIDDQQKWNDDYGFNDEYAEWDNPYYGFPQMVRFAFNPNESSKKKLDELKASGVTYAFSALFQPKSIRKQSDGSHKEFIHEQEILDLLYVIDGSKDDDNLLGFLNYDKIKQGQLCRHIVIVLPYCASCDALQALIETHVKSFTNLNDYEIINISGIDAKKKYKTPQDIINKIAECEASGTKTITLTVNRMLTGSTVPEWDTMLYLKDTASPQEYDQAIFRLQNQYIKNYIDDDGNLIKFNMKPQTLLVDFDPQRMFVMQELKAQIYNVNTDKSGNTKARERLEKELKVSPIVTVNKDKIVEVSATDILKVISDYHNDRGIKDEALEIPVDLDILRFGKVFDVIQQENEIGSKAGLATPAHKDKDNSDGDELEVPLSDEDSPLSDNLTPTSKNTSDNETTSLTKKIQNYYTRILLFAFITKDTVQSLSDIVRVINIGDNVRIADNLGLDEEVLSIFSTKYNPWTLSKLDYKIQDLSGLSHAQEIDPIKRAEIAMHKFGKLGDAIVVTPPNICDDMIALLPDDFLLDVAQTNGRILDIAGTTGEFAAALYKRFVSLGVEQNIISNLIYTIPKSSICYELTRKMYEMLGLNPNNIANRFVARDLLGIKSNNEIDYDGISLLLSHKNFYNLEWTDKGASNMCKFNAVVGNPPYQEIVSVAKGNSSLGKQLFPGFIKIAASITKKYATLITPSKWFTSEGQDGSFPALREFVKTNNHIRYIRNYSDNNGIFDGISLGAVNYFLYDTEYNGNVSFNDGETIIERPMFEDGLDVIFTMQQMVSIVNKVRYAPNFQSLMELTQGRDAFGIPGKKEYLLANTKESPFENCVSVRCAYELIRYIAKDKIRKNLDIVEHYKVFTSKGNGAAGTVDINSANAIIGRAYVGEPNSACSDSLIPIGCFDTLKEAENLAKYMATKFLRFMVGTMKTSRNIYQVVYRFVPIQDFNNNSDINWSKSIPEIDAQLYAKYNLTKDEIAFIEKLIKPME